MSAMTAKNPTCAACGDDPGNLAYWYVGSIYCSTCYPLAKPGYRILPPGALDPETLEAAEKCCDTFDAPVSNSYFVNGQATAAQQIRAAIRDLQNKDNEDSGDS